MVSAEIPSLDNSNSQQLKPFFLSLEGLSNGMESTVHFESLVVLTPDVKVHIYDVQRALRHVSLHFLCPLLLYSCFHLGGLSLCDFATVTFYKQHCISLASPIAVPQFPPSFRTSSPTSKPTIVCVARRIVYVMPTLEQ